MLNCVSVLYNQKNPTHTPSYSLIISWNMLPLPDTHTHAGFLPPRTPPRPPACFGNPTRANWFGVALKAKPRDLAGLSNFFPLSRSTSKNLSIAAKEKNRKASSGLEADRLRNINKIWSSGSFLERREEWQRQIHAKRKPHSFEKRREERRGEERRGEERRGETVCF